MLRCGCLPVSCNDPKCFDSLRGDRTESFQSPDVDEEGVSRSLYKLQGEVMCIWPRYKADIRAYGGTLHLSSNLASCFPEA